MREYVTFSINVESGEADLTPASRTKIDDWIAMGDLWAADVLKDISGISTKAYNDSLHSLSREFDSIRAAQNG